MNWFYNHELGLLKKWVYMYEYVIFLIGYAISPFRGWLQGLPFPWWWHLYESLGPPARSAHIAAAEGNGPEGNWRYFGHGDFMTAKNDAWPVRSETLPMKKSWVQHVLTRKDGTNMKETPRIEVSPWQIKIQPVRMGIWPVQWWRSNFKCRCLKVTTGKTWWYSAKRKHVVFPGIFYQDLVSICRVNMDMSPT